MFWGLCDGCILGGESLLRLLNDIHQGGDLWRRAGNIAAFDLRHDLCLQIRLKERPDIETLPPAVQNQSARFAAGFRPAIAEGNFMAEAGAS
jgi:hypothetical protein